MARQAAIHRAPLGVGMARRVIGGTLMASGAAAAAFFALMTAWLATEILGDIVRSGLGDPAAAWASLKVVASGGLAVGACALIAWLGRLTLGPRSPS